MLARYQIVRGKRRPDDPLPEGLRVDVRKHTRHVLRPDAGAVTAYLRDPTDEAFQDFAHSYQATLGLRFRKDRSPFDELARAAMRGDVYLGCNCPTKTNPDVARCHTVAALRFMKEHYPRVPVRIPKKKGSGRMSATSPKQRAARPQTRRWSAAVTAKSDAMDLEPGVFTQRPRAMARSLQRSAERSTRLKSTPYRSAMSMLTFYENRAGKNLPTSRRQALQQAKDELRKLYGR